MYELKIYTVFCCNIFFLNNTFLVWVPIIPFRLMERAINLVYPI